MPLLVESGPDLGCCVPASRRSRSERQLHFIGRWPPGKRLLRILLTGAKHAHGIIANIGYVYVARLVHRQTPGCPQLRFCRGATVAGITRSTYACDRGNHSLRRDFADAVTPQYEYIAG